MSRHLVCDKVSCSFCPSHQILATPLFDINWASVKLRLHDITGCTTGWTTGCIVQTNIQPVIKPVWQPVGCLCTRYNLLSNRLSNQFYNRFDNRLHRVNGVLVSQSIKSMCIQYYVSGMIDVARAGFTLKTLEASQPWLLYMRRGFTGRQANIACPTASQRE